MLKQVPASAARYIAKFRNGAWHVFDRIWYGVVGAELTQRLANERAHKLNTRKPVQGVRK